jgi:hypothetical protein
MRNVAFSLQRRKEAVQRSLIDAMLSGSRARCWLRAAGDAVRVDQSTPTSA